MQHLFYKSNKIQSLFYYIKISYIIKKCLLHINSDSMTNKSKMTSGSIRQAPQNF